MVTEYNRRFSVAKKFNQGRYIRQGNDERINIFQFANDAQLKTVLAHEAGHAMGLEHVGNPRSLMHAIMQQQDIYNLSLSDEDLAAIRNRCEQP
ncbi:MAG: matrixin family metalloprotease [Fodinibius sp.]|nr:matrixin family metalloprotease [Fodinibius sp.]